MDGPRYLAWTVKEKGVGLEFPGCLFGYSDHWLIYLHGSVLQNLQAI